MKRIEKKFVNGVTPIDANDMNEIVNAINEIYFKIEYLFYQKTDPKKAAEIMAQILGQRDDAEFK